MPKRKRVLARGLVDALGKKQALGGDSDKKEKEAGKGEPG